MYKYRIKEVNHSSMAQPNFYVQKRVLFLPLFFNCKYGAFSSKENAITYIKNRMTKKQITYHPYAKESHA